MCCLQNLNILMIGAKNGKGGFFPKGISGRINTPEDFDKLADGLEDWTGQKEAVQVTLAQLVVCLGQHVCYKSLKQLCEVSIGNVTLGTLAKLIWLPGFQPDMSPCQM